MSPGYWGFYIKWQYLIFDSFTLFSCIMKMQNLADMLGCQTIALLSTEKVVEIVMGISLYYNVIKIILLSNGNYVIY